MRPRTIASLLALALACAPLAARADGSVTVTALSAAKIAAGGPGSASASVAFPDFSSSSATIEFSDTPVCDPWDRLFSVSIDGVEVLRGTTPRTTFTVTYDVSQYTGLLRGTHTVTAFLANYWEQQYSDCGNSGANQWHAVTVRFALTPGTNATAPSRFVSGWNLRALSNPGGDPGCAGTNIAGIDSSVPVTIPDGTYTHAAFYGYVTSHGCEEQWFLNPPPAGGGTQGSTVICSATMAAACALRTTHVLVDGREVGSWQPKPYTYAFFGLVGGETPNSNGVTEHQFMWWTAQQEGNSIGAYTGVGVIPPYTLDLTKYLPYLTGGAHTLELRIDGGGDYWITSGELLLG